MARHVQRDPDKRKEHYPDIAWVLNRRTIVLGLLVLLAYGVLINLFAPESWRPYLAPGGSAVVLLLARWLNRKRRDERG